MNMFGNMFVMMNGNVLRVVVPLLFLMLSLVYQLRILVRSEAHTCTVCASPIHHVLRLTMDCFVR